MAVTTLGYAPSSSLGGTGMGYVVGGPSTTSLMPLGSSGSGSGSGVWMSPYETQQYNLNRNPAYRSYYDLPAEVRNNPLAPSDYLPLSESYHVPGLSHPFGGLTSSSNPSNPSNHPVQPAVPFNAFQGKAIEMQRCRIRIMGQRVSTDVNPAVHLAGFLLFDANGLPIRTAPDAVASCTSGGISPLGEEPQKAVDDSLGTRFTRKGFSTFPVDLEIDLRRTVAVASYAWRTAEDRPELDPVAWVFQAYFPHGWVTLDSATEYPTPIHRFAMVGPFRADGRSGNEVTDPAGAGGGGGANPSSPPRISPNLFAGPNALSPPHNQHHPQNLYGYGAGFDPVQAQAARKASEYLHEFVGDGCRQDNPEGRVRELLARGADPNFKDGKGRTTFMKACARAPVPIIAELIRHGADVNSQSLSGETGLHRLVLWGDQEPIALLLRSGANPNLQDAQGDSPLMIASARMDVDTVRLLLQHGASPALRNHKGLSAQDMLELEVRKQVGPGQPYPPHGTQVWSMLTGRPTPQAPPPGLATPMPPGAIPVPVQPVPIIQPQPSGGGGGGGGGAPIAPGYPPPPGPSNLANNRPPPIQPYR